MSTPNRIWAETVAGEGRELNGLCHSREEGVHEGDIAYVRGDIHKAATDELRRLRDVVGDVDRAIIDDVLINAGEAP